MNGEAVIFGDPKVRQKTLEAWKKRWVADKTFSLFQMSMKSKNNQFNAAPHAYVLNLGDRSLKCDALTGPAADKIPMELEPRLAATELLELNTSQLVNCLGVVTKVGDPKNQTNGKSVIEVSFADSKGKEIPVNYWDENHAKAKSLPVNKPLYIYGAYLTIEKSGGRHLTANKTTTTVEASGELPLAKALGAADILNMQRESLHKGDGDTSSDQGPAISANVGILELAAHFKQKLPDALYEVPNCMLSLQDNSEESLLTRDKERVWTKVTIADYAHSASADLSEKAALVLADAADKDEFVEQATTGSLAFSRARLRIRFAPQKDGPDCKLAVVAALPCLFETPESHLVPASDTRIIPVLLDWASASPTGQISVALPFSNVKRLATGVLALMVATKDPKSDPHAEGWAIRNFVCEALGDNKSQVWEAITSAVSSRLPRYALPKKERALMHITHIDTSKKELTVADVWKVPSSADITDFEKEMNATATILSQPSHIVKRKAEDFDETLQGFLTNKRVHAEFGGPSEAKK